MTGVQTCALPILTGESPIVDVQSAKRETTMSSDVIRSLPTVRNYNAMVPLIPGVITNTNDVATGPLINQFPIHGGRANESRLTVDGLNIGNPPGGNQPPTYVADVANSQEVTFTTSGATIWAGEASPVDVPSHLRQTACSSQKTPILFRGVACQVIRPLAFSHVRSVNPGRLKSGA